MSAASAAGPVPTLLSCSWLKENINKEDVKVLDASWYVPNMERSPGVKFDAHKEFEAKRIPGALFFDIDKVCDSNTDLPHMIPTPEFFAECVGKLGIKRGDHVVLYDGKGFFSSPRAWYTFRVFGHERVSILDGGFPAWERSSLPLDTSPLPCTANAPQVVKYEGAQLLPGRILTLKDVEAQVVETANPSLQLVDARPKARFIGEAPEPRPIESGHIANTLNVPWADVVNPAGALKSESEIRQIFESQRVDLSKPTALTCGSGATACILAVALHELGYGVVPLYDGAYTEWKMSGRPTYKAFEKTIYTSPSA